MQVDAVLSYFEDLKAQHHQVSNKSRALTDSCESLVRSLHFYNDPCIAIMLCYKDLSCCVLPM